jgi:hypothetical protein
VLAQNIQPLENAPIDFVHMRGFFATADKGGFIGCTPTAGEQRVKRGRLHQSIARRAVSDGRKTPLESGTGSASLLERAGPTRKPISLPADGIRLPFEPNENLGTFSIGQHTDRQIGLSARQDITPRQKPQRKAADS